MWYQRTRRQFLSTLPAATALAVQGRRPPNFVVIVTDDHGVGDVGCYGAADARTPNLDALASSGVRFTQWYSNAPVCSASRAAILTGKYPDRTGVKGALTSMPTFDVPGLREDEVTLASVLKKGGYRSAAIGKWHLGSAVHSRPRSQGFDEFFGWYSGWLDAYSHRYYQLGSPPGRIFHDMWRNDEEVFEEPAYATEVLGREAQAFLDRQNRRQPFLLYLAFGAPHYSMMAPRKYLDRFPASMERDRRWHLAMVAAVDDVVGAITSQLRRQELDRDTVVLFVADNGATREERASSLSKPYAGGSNGIQRGYKLGLFDGGMHVPAIVRAPGYLEGGKVWDRPVASMDITPTLLSMAGLKPPPGTDGRDLVPVVRDGRAAHEYLFWSFGNQRAVRHGDWKLIVNPPNFPGEEVNEKLWLSNLEADPSEKKNLAPADGERTRQLLERVQGWEKEMGLPAAYKP